MKLNQQDIFKLIAELRDNLPKKGVCQPFPSITDVAGAICNKLSIQCNQHVNNIAMNQLKQFKNKKGKSDSKETIINSEEYTPPQSPPTPLQKKRKSLEQITSRDHLARRVKPVFDQLKKFADEEDIPVPRLLGLLLTFSRKKDISDIGESLWNETFAGVKSQIPIETSLAIYSDCNLGRQTYTNMQKILQADGFSIFPAWNHIRKEQLSITPNIHFLEGDYSGVYFKMKDAIKHTVRRILQLTNVNLPGHEINLQVKFGFDGSGNHSIYNQRNTSATNNIIMSMLCPLKATDNENNEIYVQPLPNSTLSQRPLCLQMGKESVDNLRSLDMYNAEISSLENEGTQLETDSKVITVRSKIISYMLDGKAAKLYTGLGGAYCDLCSFSKEECINRDQITQGFNITRDINDIINYFNDNVDEDGNVITAKGDYKQRGGVTTGPIATNQVISTQILHSMLRTFDHFMKVVVHIKAGVFSWSKSNSTDKLFLQTAKKQLQDVIKEKIHNIKWDFPDSTGKGGTTTTGNVARELLLNPENRKIIIGEILEKDREAVLRYGEQLAVILRVFCSSESVNVQQYKDFCTQLYLHLIDSFPRQRRSEKNLAGPWISITPTLHKLLAHSWELIELNNSEGLKRLDESGMEGCNKILRRIRMNLSRKTSQNESNVDSLRRIWIGSDPVLQQQRMRALPFCKHCEVHGHGTRYCKLQNLVMNAAAYEDYLFGSLTCSE